MSVDIHNFQRQYRYAQERVRNSNISDRNKALIFSYRDACLLHQVCGTVRLTRAFPILVQLAQALDRDFDSATMQDFKTLVAGFLHRGLRPSTISTYKAVLKRFVTFVTHQQTFPHASVPESIAWLHSHVKKRDQTRLQRHDLLTPHEVQALLGACQHPRDRALVSLLWETGSRVAEIGNLQVKHLTKQPVGYTISINGKTGSRNPLVISSAPHLSAWLSHHPRNERESPLWVLASYGEEHKHLSYSGIRALLRRLLKHAGINKRLYPHLFRHSRATYALANGIMNESQAKAYFGWTPDSDMLGTYTHLVDQDANNAILKEHHLTPAIREQHDTTVQQCSRCSELNTKATSYCTRCGNPLNETAARAQHEHHTATEDLLVRLCKVLVERGLLDEAARQVHHAGMGAALKRLAQQQAFGKTTPLDEN